MHNVCHIEQAAKWLTVNIGEQSNYLQIIFFVSLSRHQIDFWHSLTMHQIFFRFQTPGSKLFLTIYFSADCMIVFYEKNNGPV